MLGQLIDGQEMLREGQRHPHRDLIALRDEVRRGNRSLHEALISERARREADTLEQKMHELQAFQILCARAFQTGRRPAYDDVRRRIDLAVRLISGVDKRVQRIALRDAERFGKRQQELTPLATVILPPSEPSFRAASSRLFHRRSRLCVSA